MKFKEIIKRLTGISTPVFGVSWNPTSTERDIAKDVVTYLEDRRVLYVPSEMEQPHHCVMSILEIRKYLTDAISKLEQDSELAKSLRALRAACRKFLELTDSRNGDIVRYGAHSGHWASWQFNGALGELRGVFGIHIAKIAAAYGLNVENDLSLILPREDVE
ncbi:MAG: DUF6650 family protein [bacterium]|nr:hypothetical protein [Dehalococcoidales bacterium]